MRSPLTNRFCEELGIEYPIILAGMGGAACPTLAAAVSEAGGLGVLGLTGFAPDRMAEWIDKVRSLTDKPFGVDIIMPEAVPESGNREELEQEYPEEHVRFVETLKREFNIPEPSQRTEGLVLTQDYYRRQADVVLDMRVPVFFSGLGSPGWMVPDAHSQGMKVVSVIGAVKHARRVVEAGVDAVVACGTEGGGHTGHVGTMVLVPQVIDAVHPTPVIAAGGIGDGRGLAASLALGAQGVWCGTLFLSAEEAWQDDRDSGRMDEWSFRVRKQQLIDARIEDARIGKMYSGKTVRHLYNRWSAAWDRPEAPPPLPTPYQLMLTHDALQGASEAHMQDFLFAPAGQVTGMIREIRPAAEIMAAMVRDAEAILTGFAPDRGD